MLDFRHAHSELIMSVEFQTFISCFSVPDSKRSSKQKIMEFSGDLLEIVNNILQYIDFQ